MFYGKTTNGKNDKIANSKLKMAFYQFELQKWQTFGLQIDLCHFGHSCEFINGLSNYGKWINDK